MQFFKRFILICVFGPHVWGCPQKSEEGAGYFGTGITGRCELPSVTAGSRTQVYIECS